MNLATVVSEIVSCIRTGIRVYYLHDTGNLNTVTTVYDVARHLNSKVSISTPECLVRDLTTYKSRAVVSMIVFDNDTNMTKVIRDVQNYISRYRNTTFFICSTVPPDVQFHIESGTEQYRDYHNTVKTYDLNGLRYPM